MADAIVVPTGTSPVPAPVPVPEYKINCPDPMVIELTANTPNILMSDFNAAELAHHTDQLNYQKNNTFYLHTFVWKPKAKCCQVTKAILVVRMKALEKGTATGSDSGNDLIAIVGNGGAPILPYDERVYPPGNHPAGTLATKIWDIQGAALDRINTNHTLSFLVEDDTSVLSATLTLYVCCLKS